MSTTGILRSKTKIGESGKSGIQKKTGQTSAAISNERPTPAELSPIAAEVAGEHHPPDLRCPDTVVRARAGDHHAIHRLLVSLLHQPSAAEFQAQLEDPGYDPGNRLVVKRNDHVVAHAHLVNRQIYFGQQTLPIVVINDFVVLPELKSEGIESLLLGAIQEHIIAVGAQYGVLRTSKPDFFLKRGWSVCLRHSYSTASALAILSHLRESMPPPPRNLLGVEQAKLTVRIWRHVEQAALVRLYQKHSEGTFGPSLRADDYWQWLISRRGYDRIYVAIDGPDRMDLDDSQSPIVGYAVMREGRILELVTEDNAPAAATALLARTCQDAIEQDRHYVQLDAAPGDSLHSVFKAAGGERYYHEAESGQVSMVWLAERISLLRSLCKEMTGRSKQGGLHAGSELGLQLDGDKYGLSVGSHSTKLTEGRIGRSYLECDPPTFAQLLLGHMDVQAAVANGRLLASTRVAIETASALFPQLPIWRPPWDESPAA
jgi:predicted N-acetyltransferase YhbS